MKKGKKIVTLVLMFVIVIVCAVGGTLAWLKDSTETITNTFRYGKVDIELIETTGYFTSENNYEFLISEGAEIIKDPTVIVKGGSEDSYIFIKIAGDYDSFVEFEMNPIWIPYNRPVGENEKLYYMMYEQTDEDVELEVLRDNTVRVKDGVTNEVLETNRSGVKLDITAYAVQAYNEDGLFQIDDAWDLVDPSL